MLRFDGLYRAPQRIYISSATSGVKPLTPRRVPTASFASPQPAITPSQWPRRFPKTKAVREVLSHCSHISALKGGATSVLAGFPEEACSDCWRREQPELQRVVLRAAKRSQCGSEIGLAMWMLRVARFWEERNICFPSRPIASRIEQYCEQGRFVPA